MAKPTPLSWQKLRARLDPEKVPYADSTEINSKSKSAGRPLSQPRALEALRLGMRIKDKGYNVYLAGEPNMGRSFMVQDFLAPEAAKASPPPDLVYVNNFDNEDKPKLLQLPSGMGRKLKTELTQVLATIRKELPARFENESYLNKRTAIMEKFQTVREQLVDEMESEAAGQGFNLDVDDQGGMTLYPLVEGKLLSEDEFEKLDPNIRKRLKATSEKLMNAMQDLLRKMNREEKGFQENEQNLDLEILEEVLAEYFDPLAKRFGEKVAGKDFADYLKDMRQDILDNLDQFAPKEPAPPPLLPESALGHLGGDSFQVRYDINVFVDNSELKGAPIIIEDHPTSCNLLGCVERESEMGALITDFTLIKSGALHRANGGYLLLHVEDMMQHTSAWEGLLRALRSGLAKIEDTDDSHEQSRSRTIEPQPVPVNVKVVLVGTDDVFELLHTHDDRFPKLFKIKAHMQDSMPRNMANIRGYFLYLSRIIEEAGLMPFSRSALAGLADFSSRLAGDQKKLSLKLPLLRELMVEAAALAEMDGKKMVDNDVLRAAEAARDYRSNLYEEEFMEEYDRDLIKLPTSGESVGRVNGLSVSWYGDYEFGLPHQIACTVGVGDSGVVDLEREAELGGPIHTKAMMILKGYLSAMFAHNKPLVFSGSLCFEQSYAGVEGDSASGAELAALLSALSDKPINFSLAFTGAVSQSGAIMAVGGVTRKIEGFFEVCKRQGLTGGQGVLLPADNRDHLMLKDEVVEAVKDGRFHIYPIRRIEEAMELLTGMPAGRRLKSGGFPANSLYRLVDDRLAEMTAMYYDYQTAKRPRKRR